MLIVSKHKMELYKLKSLLSSKFEMKDLGAFGQILGLDIRHDYAQKLFKGQQEYNEQI